jgi:hypothetical protein
MSRCGLLCCNVLHRSLEVVLLKLFKSDRTSYCTTVRCMSRRRHQHVVFDPKFLCPGSNDFSAYILSCYHLDCFLLPLHLVIGKCNMTRLIRFIRPNAVNAMGK